MEVISGWREKLARYLTENNPTLTPRSLNFAVQMILDRIIFLRICEDRGVETEFRLSPLLNGTNTYARLLEVFRHADDRYNSGLFHFKKEAGRDAPDSITGNLHITDRPIKEILAGLYYPESPFEFSVFPADILGQVYEQFLGKVIRIESKTAVVEDKPEVKKAGGVFYTPTYIVDYIVEHTVGRLLQGKTLKQVCAISILDPACGSGSFLIGVYQFLLDWHLRWYVANEPEKEAKRKSAAVFQNGTDEQSRPRWRLTTAEKKRILLNNIYGVDIDTQAVEVTKLSLLLKVLEGESAETVNANLKLFKERALPDLEANIRCSNSLVSLDFYADPAYVALSTEEQVRINAFDWNAAFPTIMQNGGFDAVIGNPPYIFGEYHDAAVKRYFQTQYELARGQYDTYWLFIERGLSLTRRKGYFSLIVPDALLARDEVMETRFLLLNAGLESVYHCGLVFENAAVSAAVFCVLKGISGVGMHGMTRDDKQAVSGNICSTHRFKEDARRRFLIHMSDEQAEIIKSLHQRCTTFEDAKLLHISRGEEIGKKFVLNSGPILILVGEDISRYQVKAPSRFVAEYFKSSAFYASPKIVLVKTGDKAIAALDKTGLVTMQSVYNLHITDETVVPESVLAILNSKLIRFYLSKTFTAYKLLFPQINQTTVLSLPVPKDFALRQNPLIVQAERMDALYTQLTQMQTAQERDVAARQITATDAQIDKLVYELYELTAEEIKLVEAE